MEQFKTGSVRANGIQFHYLEAGSGPLVLCLHGFPDHARSFRFQLPALAKAGFRAVAPYLRGYAPTDVPANGPFQYAALAKDAAALVEALSPKEPGFVFGHDWGAVATYGAAQIAPQRIGKRTGRGIAAAQRRGLQRQAPRQPALGRIQAQAAQPGLGRLARHQQPDGTLPLPAEGVLVCARR